MLEDEGFQLPTEPARAAVKCAEGLLEWISDHPDMAANFASLLIGKIQGCIHGPKKLSKRSVQRGREKMWESFYKLTSSEEFRKGWKMLLETVKVEATPIFYQYVTDTLMKELIKEKFHFTPPTESSISPLDYEDINSLQYTAGYVIRSLTKKISKSAHPLKEDMKTCLAEMIEANVVDGMLA